MQQQRIKQCIHLLMMRGQRDRGGAERSENRLLVFCFVTAAPVVALYSVPGTSHCTLFVTSYSVGVLYCSLSKIFISLCHRLQVRARRM